MNNNRRKEIKAITDKLDALRDLISEITEAVEQVRDDEQEYYGNMPEGLQGSDRGYAAEAAISSLEDAVSMLGDLDVETLMGNLETAAE